MRITFVATNYGTREILENNFLASPCLRGSHSHQILVQRDFVSAGKAYNDAIDRATNDLLVFAHQDVIFPEFWPSQLERALSYLAVEDPGWGVLGCWGVTRDRKFLGHIYSSGLGVLGGPFQHPEPVQTLDEIVLIVRKSSGLRFDDRLPHFHMYGTDICLRAASMGRTSYAVPAFCVHNTDHNLVLPTEFYECYRYIKRVWRHDLPIQTPCIRITKSGLPLYVRWLHGASLRYVRRQTLVAPRAKDTPQLLIQAGGALRRI